MILKNNVYLILGTKIALFRNIIVQNSHINSQIKSIISQNYRLYAFVISQNGNSSQWVEYETNICESRIESLNRCSFYQFADIVLIKQDFDFCFLKDFIVTTLVDHHLNNASFWQGGVAVFHKEQWKDVLVINMIDQCYTVLENKYKVYRQSEIKSVIEYYQFGLTLSELTLNAIFPGFVPRRNNYVEIFYQNQIKNKKFPYREIYKPLMRDLKFDEKIKELIIQCQKATGLRIQSIQKLRSQINWLIYQFSLLFNQKGD